MFGEAALQRVNIMIVQGYFQLLPNQGSTSTTFYVLGSFKTLVGYSNIVWASVSLRRELGFLVYIV